MEGESCNPGAEETEVWGGVRLAIGDGRTAKEEAIYILMQVVGRSWRQARSLGVPDQRVGTTPKSGEGQSRSIVGIVEYQDPSM